jgi:hypothetical protein
LPGLRDDDWVDPCWVDLAQGESIAIYKVWAIDGPCWDIGEVSGISMNVLQLWRAYRRVKKEGPVMFEKLKSRKLWALVVSAAMAALNSALGSPVPDEMMTKLLLLAGTYILGQGAVDTAAALKKPTP